MILDDKTIVPTQTQTGTTNQLNLIPVRSSNPLSQYASYTYQLSLYAITPEAYNLYQINNKQFLPKDQGVALIVQSGGINNTSSNRAAGFEFDYYIDDVIGKKIDDVFIGSCMLILILDISSTHPLNHMNIY